MLEIRQLPALKDNYIYLARDPETEACAAIDPAAADPVLGALDRLGWRLTLILNTHHHGDHVGGNLDLKRVTKCTIIGHKRDARRIPGIDLAVEEGDHVAIGAQKGTVLDVSGHTVGHIAYWFPGSFALFCGDTLFSLGCGRLFEGTAAQMWESLKKLRALPDATRVFCGHEYTEGNARFALSVDPGNRALEDRAAEVRAAADRQFADGALDPRKREGGQPVSPRRRCRPAAGHGPHRPRSGRGVCRVASPEGRLLI